MSRVYLFPILVLAFASGILLSRPLPLEKLWPLSCLVLLGGWILLSFKGRNLAAQRILAIMLFLTLGAWHGNKVWHKSSPAVQDLGACQREPCDLEGILVGGPELRSEGVRLLVEVQTLFRGPLAKPLHTRMLLTIGKGAEKFRYGDRLRFKISLREPGPRLNPGGIHWAQQLALRGVAFLGFLPDAEHLVLRERGRGQWGIQQMEDLRWKLARVIHTELPSPAREVLLALTVGQAGGLSTQLRESFATLGLSHLLAISGLHFGLVAVCVYWVFRKLLSFWTWFVLRFQVQKTAWLLTVPVLLAYGIVAGMAPSVQRSLIMVLALAAALLLDRARRFYHALALAALIILMMNPSCLFELSFQLSFLAVLGILYGLPRLMSFLPGEDPGDTLPKKGALHAWSRRVFLAAGSTLAASLATLPLAISRFHLVPFLGIPANLLGVPLLGWLILPTALLGSFLYLLWESGGLALLWVAAWMADWAVRIVFWAASLGGSLYLPTPKPWEILIFYLICLGLCNVRKFRWARWATLGLVIFLPVLWGLEWASRLGDPRLRLHFISVGNGTSVLVEAPRGESLLLDGGGSLEGGPEVGAMQVAPVLWERRIMSLNRVILTHPHPDHLGGLLVILRAFRVTDGVWENGDRPNEPAYQEFVRSAQARGWRPKALCSGETWCMGEARLEVLHPPCESFRIRCKSRSSETNNRSLVLRVKLGEASVLLPGDVEAEAEKLLVGRENLASTVLLAPHHGSKSSSSEEFLKVTRPRIVVFSSRAGDKGLVHPQVLQRYRELGAEIFHTGEDGMISLETDGQDLSVKSYATGRNYKIHLGG